MRQDAESLIASNRFLFFVFIFFVSFISTASLHAYPEYVPEGKKAPEACVDCHGIVPSGFVEFKQDKSAMACEIPSNAKVDFVNDVYPELESCASAACHGAAGGAADFKISLFCGDARADFPALKYSGSGRLVSCDSPDDSLILKKVSGRLKHAGGAPFKSDSDSYKILRDWIASGCKYESADAPKLIGLDIECDEHKTDNGEFNPKVGSKFRIVPFAVYSDGKRREVAAKVTLSGAAVTRNPDVSFNADRVGYASLVFSYSRKFKSVGIYVSPKDYKAEKSEYSANPLDLPYLQTLALIGLKPAPDCSDSDFIRRLYLDSTGLLPPPEVTQKFLSSTLIDKREQLVRSVLDSSEFVDFISMRFGDMLRIKSEFPSNLWPNAVQAYNEWIRHAVARNLPYDKFARALLDSTGTNFRDPTVNFYRAVNEKNATNYADAASLVFMGARMNCIKCHAHPSESWTAEDARAMAAFFSQIKFKGSKEWKEEILTVDPSIIPPVQPRTLDGFSPKISAGSDARLAFVDWLLSPDNKWFARAAVNRFWTWIFGRGIINPPDDIRPNNLPTNPALLSVLESEFKKDYDIRRLFYLIYTSKAYSRSSRPAFSPETSLDELAFFARRSPKRLESESLHDIINIFLGLQSHFKSIVPEPYSFWPTDFKAINLSDGSVGNAFLSLFGKPARNSSYYNDRSNAVTMSQVMRLANFSATDFSTSPTLKALEKLSPKVAVRKLYLSLLCREPSKYEMERIESYLNTGGNLADIAWALINTKEFVFKM